MIQKNVSLKEYTTFKIGGKARHFFIAKNKDDLVSAVIFAKKHNLPFFILGGGSNLLISDQGFNGLAIKMKNTECKIMNTKIFTDAGVRIGDLVNVSVKNSLAGLEWASGIPGTLGGAIYGNAGTVSKSIGDSVMEVDFFDSKKLKFGKLPKKDCRFGYRDSIFKHQKSLIIISALLKLKRGKKKKIKDKIKKYLDRKRESQPLDLPSVGSIFKNPNKFSAGELIEKCGLKGKKIGNVEISKKHANFIVNLKGGEARDVLILIKTIKKSVKNKFNIKLEEEIQYLGFEK